MRQFVVRPALRASPDSNQLVVFGIGKRVKQPPLLAQENQSENPFAWNGVIVFWMPFCVFGVWLFSLGYTLLIAITRQEKAAAADGI